MAVYRESPGQGQPRCQQECRPVNGVEPHDILTQDVMHIRPKLPRFFFIRKPQNSQVVGKRIHPHVYAVRRVPWNGYAPLDTIGGAGNADVLKAALYHILQLHCGIEKSTQLLPVSA